MSKIPLQYAAVTSLVIFIILNFGLGGTTLFGIADSIMQVTSYYFGVGIFTFDYLVIAIIPVLGVVRSSLRSQHDLKNIMLDYLFLLVSALFSFIIGLIILTKIGTIKNPLIPQHLIAEPFKVYSTIFLSIGLIIPFLVVKKEVIEEDSEIENIGKTDNS